MTHDDFLCHYLQLADGHCDPQTKLVLARVADTTRNGLVVCVLQQDHHLPSLLLASFLWQNSVHLSLS